MKRFFLKLAYNGTAFHGWQIQPNANTVQAEIEKAMFVILRTPTPVLGCGRTDTGVHAKEFFLHFDTNFIPESFVYKLNSILPKTIAIEEIIAVKNDTHARFDALERTYEYHISTKKNPFLINKAHFSHLNLDLELMNEAGKTLLETNDFACFCKAGADSKTTLCDVRKAEWVAQNEVLFFTISANRFLRNMVRAIVGTLLEIGEKKINLDQFKTILASKNRSMAGKSVTAAGLYLTQVKYPNSIIKNE